MSIELREIAVPNFGLPEAQPIVPPARYAARCEQAYKLASCDWLVVYADREHFANMMFLCGFEPRFEEALLLLGPNSRCILLVGIECFSYAKTASLPDLEILLCTTFSLMGLDRSGLSLPALMRNAGIHGHLQVGLVGWKYFERTEWTAKKPGFFVPSFLVEVICDLIADPDKLIDATRVFMDPVTGIRATVDADQIALAEWGAARGSAAMWRIVKNLRSGDTELLAASRMNYAGEPMNAHVMVSGANASSPVLGLRSPTARSFQTDDSGIVATSYWGGLSARAGLINSGNDTFLELARCYMEAIIAWYSVTDIGVHGGKVFEAVTSVLSKAGMHSALNPGHISGHDEWMHTPIRENSAELVSSGSLFQVDISPTPLPTGWALVCIDGVAIADECLRRQIRERHPEVFSRMQMRRQFVRNILGVDLKESILPLSSVPLCLPPFWLKSDHLLVSQ